MLMSCEQIGSFTVITVHRSRIDAVIAGNFKEQGRDLIVAAGQDCLMDLSKVSFMDSSGVGALVGLLKIAGTDYRLELCSLTPAVRNIMKLTRLDQVFRISPSVDEALRAEGLSRPGAA